MRRTLIIATLCILAFAQADVQENQRHELHQHKHNQRRLRHADAELYAHEQQVAEGGDQQAAKERHHERKELHEQQQHHEQKQQHEQQQQLPAGQQKLKDTKKHRMPLALDDHDVAPDKAHHKSQTHKRQRHHTSAGRKSPAQHKRHRSGKARAQQQHQRQNENGHGKHKRQPQQQHQQSKRHGAEKRVRQH